MIGGGEKKLKKCGRVQIFGNDTNKPDEIQGMHATIWSRIVPIFYLRI